jgi:hypothetical protein
MALDPALRPPSAGSLAADLEALRSGAPVSDAGHDPRKTTFWQHLSRVVRRA